MAGSAIETGVTIAMAGLGGLKTAGTFLQRVGPKVTYNFITGAGFGTGHALQDNKSTPQALINGFWTGALMSAMPIIGEGVSKVKSTLTEFMPERLYSTLFKQSQDDFIRFIKTENLMELKKSSPELFNEMVRSGVVNIGKGGTIAVNPTLAKEALVRKIWGSHKTILKYFHTKQLQQEMAARQAVAGKFLEVKNKSGYVSMLRELSDRYKARGHGFETSVTNKADQLILELEKVGARGRVPGELALELRRFIDGVRNTSSFRMDPSLSASQAAYKTAADSLRQKIAAIPGMGSIMNEYRFVIQGFDAVVADAVRTSNKDIIGLTDAILGGGGIAGGELGTGLGAMTAIRAFKTAPVQTAAGQLLHKAGQVGTGPVGRSAIELGRQSLLRFGERAANLISR